MMIVLFVSKLGCVFAKENSNSDVRQSFYYYDKLNNFIKVEHLNKDFGLIKLKFIKSNLFQKPSEDKLKGFLTKLIETDVQCTFQKMFCDISSCSSNPCTGCVEKCYSDDDCSGVLKFFGLNTTNCNNKYLVMQGKIVNSNYQVIDIFN